MAFNIIRNDITKLDVDIIVNAANSRLKAGGGVCGAIFSAAGKESLQRECDKIGFCAIGDAVVTKAFALPAKYIIHTVGPIYGKNPECEEQELYSCYENSLQLAKKKGASSIAFPVISSGIYGYPKADAVRIAAKAIKDFLQDNDMTVYLVVYDKDTYIISEKLFSKVKSYIDERMVKHDLASRRSESQRISYYNLLDTHNDDIAEKNISMPSLCPTINYPQSCLSSDTKRTKRSLSDLINKKLETFSEMLLRLIDEKEMTDVEVYKRANIDRKLFSKIRKKDYTPKKITVIALAIGLKLNMDETKDLLARAGFAFSECSKFDIIVEYFIENGIYDIFEINETLFAFDQQLLGA